tara:strand:+ start:25 stop:450 length:426 start_codon:yes stop_codon:yes gene_type:complete
MTDQEILDNAPEGATHIDNCGFYLKAGKSGFMEPDNLSNDWDYEYSNHSEVSSLADIQRIVELEKERNVKYITLDDRQLVYLTVDDLNRIKLEQQAKGLEDFAQSLMFRGCLENSFNKYDADEAAIDLRTQAKALKEQVTL